MKFRIEQLAICPPFGMREKAIELLTALGLSDWANDLVVAKGYVHDGRAEFLDVTNVASLAFNYQSREDVDKPLEFEVLSYEAGENWMSTKSPGASHLGMHVTSAELYDWHNFFIGRGIPVVQEVETQSHTNPVIAGKRFYKYTIYGTRHILGIDLKFIVRRDVPKAVGCHKCDGNGETHAVNCPTRDAPKPPSLSDCEVV